MPSPQRTARTPECLRLQDALYGCIDFKGPIARLVTTPAVQRLRRIRLSNIDSVDSPSIAGVSRYEHVIGTCHLGHKLGFSRSLQPHDALTISAACLLHDIAITPFGHLLEEALRYSGMDYAHEEKLTALLSRHDAVEMGGIELQIFEGSQSGIAEWSKFAFGTTYVDRLESILKAVLGIGKWGPCVSGAIDLDNIDNVVRLAYHMGLPVDRNLPIALVSEIVGVDETGLLWSSEAVPLLEKWIAVRYQLYSRLMLSPQDFAAKSMLTVAIVRALSNEQLGAKGYEWTLTDHDLVHRLKSMANTEVADPAIARWISGTVRRWNLGEFWCMSPLLWVDGSMPLRSQVWSFGEQCSLETGRECFAHGIPDKRHRELIVKLTDSSQCKFGRRSDKWLLGVASPQRTAFSRTESATIARLATQYFQSSVREVDLESENSLATQLPLDPR